MRSLFLTWGARKPLISMKWVLCCVKLEELCLKMERKWEANASRLPKWAWRINLCCPNFYSLFLETISKFPTIPFAVCSYYSSLASLFVWTVGSWTLSQCSPHTSNTVANSAQRLEVTLLKEGEYKTQHGMFGDLEMEMRQKGLEEEEGRYGYLSLGIKEECWGALPRTTGGNRAKKRLGWRMLGIGSIGSPRRRRAGSADGERWSEPINKAVKNSGKWRNWSPAVFLEGKNRSWEWLYRGSNRGKDAHLKVVFHMIWCTNGRIFNLST